MPTSTCPLINMISLELDAKLDQLDCLLAFINKELEKYNCPKKVKLQIDIAAEEIFSNICKYAYKSGEGKVFIGISCNSDSAELTFEDSGLKYNPLKEEEPDITLPASKRELGGLGILVVKKTMTEVDYEYRDGRNKLTIKKAFE